MYYELGLDHVYGFLSDTFNLLLVFIFAWSVKEFLLGLFRTPTEYGFRVQCGECEMDVQRSFRSEWTRDRVFTDLAIYHDKHMPVTVSTWDGIEQCIPIEPSGDD